MSKQTKERSFLQKKPSNNLKENSLQEGRPEMMHQPQNPKAKFPASRTCKHYSRQDIARYAKNEMIDKEYNDFTKHLGICMPCKQKCDAFRYKDVMENERLHTKAIAIMDAIDQGKSVAQAKLNAVRLKMLQLFIRGSRTSFEVLATTGKLLTATESPWEQFEKTNGKVTEPIKIRQEFPESRLSILAKLSQSGPWRINLCVVMYDRSTNDFLPGITMVVIRGDEILERLISNDSGETSFDLDARENYNIKIFNGADLLGHILLKCR